MAGNSKDRNHKPIPDYGKPGGFCPDTSTHLGRVAHLLSEISLHSVRIVIEHKDVGYDDPFGYIDDDC